VVKGEALSTSLSKGDIAGMGVFAKIS